MVGPAYTEPGERDDGFPLTKVHILEGVYKCRLFRALPIDEFWTVESAFTGIAWGALPPKPLWMQAISTHKASALDTLSANWFKL
jgi:sulfite exporter TauE/SafE